MRAVERSGWRTAVGHSPKMPRPLKCRHSVLNVELSRSVQRLTGATVSTGLTARCYLRRQALTTIFRNYLVCHCHL